MAPFTVGGLKMLLLSRMIGAVPEFLGTLSASSRMATKIAFIDDASQPLGDAPFVSRERDQLQDLGYSLIPVTIDESTVADFSAILDKVDGVYVAGGLIDHLMEVLRRAGADAVLVERVRGGLPYIGTSAGAMITGTTISPGIALDGSTIGISLEDSAAWGSLMQLSCPTLMVSSRLLPSKLLLMPHIV